MNVYPNLYLYTAIQKMITITHSMMWDNNNKMTSLSKYMNTSINVNVSIGY